MWSAFSASTSLSQLLKLNVSWMSFVILDITFNIYIFEVFRCIHSQNFISFWQYCKCGYPSLHCHVPDWADDLSALACALVYLQFFSWLDTLADFALATSQLYSWCLDCTWLPWHSLILHLATFQLYSCVCLGSIDHRSLVLKTRSWSWHLFASPLAQGTEVDVLTTCASPRNRGTEVDVLLLLVFSWSW